jgi:hypothetical protein
VPALWLLEVGNLLLSAQRRKRITAEKRRELAGAAAQLRIKVDREPVAITALDEIAARHGLGAYDAALSRVGHSTQTAFGHAGRSAGCGNGQGRGERSRPAGRLILELGNLRSPVRPQPPPPRSRCCVDGRPARRQ